MGCEHGFAVERNSFRNTCTSRCTLAESRLYDHRMRRDSKLSVALHILAHLAARGDRPVVSEVLASHLGTHPVVVRRSLAGLREAGIVSSVKGHGGGWTLARPATKITLGAVCTVIDGYGDLIPRLEPDPDGCKIDAAVRSTLDDCYTEANTMLMRRFDSITLADLIAEASEATPKAMLSDHLL